MQKYYFLLFLITLPLIANADEVVFNNSEYKNLDYKNLFKCIAKVDNYKMQAIPFMSNTEEKSALILSENTIYKCEIPKMKNESYFYCHTGDYSNYDGVKITIKNGVPAEVLTSFTDDIRLIAHKRITLPYTRGAELFTPDTKKIAFDRMLKTISDINSENNSEFNINYSRKIKEQYLLKYSKEFSHVEHFSNEAINEKFGIFAKNEVNEVINKAMQIEKKWKEWTEEKNKLNKKFEDKLYAHFKQYQITDTNLIERISKLVREFKKDDLYTNINMKL